MSDDKREVEVVASGNFIFRARVVEATGTDGEPTFEVHAHTTDDQFVARLNGSVVPLEASAEVVALPTHVRQSWMRAAAEAALAMFMAAWVRQNAALSVSEAPVGLSTDGLVGVA